MGKIMGTVRLSDSLVDGINSTFFTSEFHSMLEHHILNLATSEEAQALTVTDSMAHQYNGDLNGLLIALGVPLQYHWATMRCNGMYGPGEYDSTRVHLIQPSFTEIDELLTIYTTSSVASLS